MKNIPLLLVVWIWVAAVGCQTTVNTVEPAQPSAQAQELVIKKTQTDPSLSQRIKVLRVITTTSPGGYLNVQVDLRNASQSLVRYTYKVEWFDEKGLLIQTPAAGAIPRQIEGGEIQSIVLTAPTPLAKDFRIKFQEPTN